MHAVRSVVETGHAQDRERLTIAAQLLLMPRPDPEGTPALVHTLSPSEIATLAHTLAAAQRKPTQTNELVNALAVCMASHPTEAVTASDAHALVTSCHALLKVRDWDVTHTMCVLAPVFTAALRAIAQKSSSSAAAGLATTITTYGTKDAELDWGALAGAYAEHRLLDAPAELETAYILAMDSVFSAMLSVRPAGLGDAVLASVCSAWAQYDVRTRVSGVNVGGNSSHGSRGAQHRGGQRGQYDVRTRVNNNSSNGRRVVQHRGEQTSNPTGEHRPNTTGEERSNAIGEQAHDAQIDSSRAYVLRLLAEEVLLRGQDMDLGRFVDCLWGCTMHTQPMDVRVCMALTEMALYPSTAPHSDTPPASLPWPTTSSPSWGDETATTTTTHLADGSAYADDTAPPPPLATCASSHISETKLTSASTYPATSNRAHTTSQHRTATTTHNNHGQQQFTRVGMLNGEHLARIAEALAQLQLRLCVGHREAAHILLTQPPRNVPRGSRGRSHMRHGHHHHPGRYAFFDVMLLMEEIHDMFSDDSAASISRVQKKRIRLAMNKLESLE